MLINHDFQTFERMTLFVEWDFLSEKKNNIKADQARDGRRTGQMTLVDGWAKRKMILEGAKQTMGDQDGRFFSLHGPL